MLQSMLVVTSNADIRILTSNTGHALAGAWARHNSGLDLQTEGAAPSARPLGTPPCHSEEASGANICWGSTKALNSRALPLGSSKNIVACSDGLP